MPKIPRIRSKSFQKNLIKEFLSFSRNLPPFLKKIDALRSLDAVLTSSKSYHLQFWFEKKFEDSLSH